MKETDKQRGIQSLKTKLFLKVRVQIKLEISHRGDYLKGDVPFKRRIALYYRL